MLPSVRTPIFSPGGIPYMFRFNVREHAQPERQAYLGLRARYTQVLFNPATVCCIILIGLLTVVYVLVSQLLGAVRAYIVLECKALSLSATTAGSYYSQSQPVYNTFNLGVATAIEQYAYSLNASVANLQAATTSYTELLAAYYQGVLSAGVTGAYDAATNSTTELGAWAESELVNAKNYTNTLLTAIQNAVGSLGGTTNLTSNISTAIPLGLNAALLAAYSDNTSYYNISQNAEIDMASMYAEFCANMTEMLAPYTNGLAANMSLVPTTYATDGCASTDAQIDAFLKTLKHRYRTQMAFVAVLAVLFVGVAAMYIYYRWKHLSAAVQEKPSMRAYNKADNLAVTVAAWIVARTGCKSPARVEWICSYLFSSFLIKMLVVGWCCIVAALCLGDMKGSLGALDINFGSAVPSNVNVTTNGTLEVSVSILNTEVTNLELGINNNMTAELTSLVTNVASIISTVNSTLYNNTATTLSNLNQTWSTLAFDLIWGNGVTMQQISLPRIADYNLTTQEHTLALEPYGIQNITQALGKSVKTLNIVGGTLLGTYGFMLFACLLYVGLVFT